MSEEIGEKLTYKQRAFLEAYLECWNASEAARRAGYNGKSNVAGPQLLANLSIRQAIRERLNGMQMSANEVLNRLSEHARGDMGDFLDIGPMGFTIDLDSAKKRGLTHLIKKVKLRTQTSVSKDGTEVETHDMEIELYSAQEALALLGKAHGLFKDKVDITSAGEKLSGGISDDGFNRAISSLADVLRESIPGKDANQKGAMGSPEQAPVAGATDEGG